MASGLVMQTGDENFGQLLSSLSEVKSTVEGTEEDLGFLESLLGSREIQALVQVHKSITKSTRPSLSDLEDNSPVSGVIPVASYSEDLCYDVLDVLHPVASKFREARELYYVLQKPHIQCLLSAHDSVAQKDYLPRLPDIPLEVDEDEETVKIVQLVKSSEPMPGKLAFEPIVGATIKADEKTGRILIARVMHGGAADRSGLIHVGDEVHEVNGIPVFGKTPNEVLKILQESDVAITFKLIPADARFQTRETKVRVRAYFDYDPSQDQHIPCKEAGLPFDKGQILHIVSQDDAYWWQARHEGDASMRAGIIPSKALQEQRIAAEMTNGEITIEEEREIATYEDVARLYPQPRIFRPVVLFGPSGVGCNELKRRLIAMDPDKYRTTVPYTSRPKKPHEVEGQDYYFVSRESIEREILEGKFLECGEYNGNIYGTSVASVHEIVDSGHVAVITPHDQQALKRLRSPEFKPYVIFIKPPEFDRLKETRTAAGAQAAADGSASRGFADEDLKSMIDESKRFEYLYGHWFDQIVVNDDLVAAFEELAQAVHRVETEPLWAPSSWVQ